MGMTYAERQEARRERYTDLASKAQAQSTTIYTHAKKLASVIPFGQPILVGHHSENRDRNYRNGINNKFGKAFALQDKAEHYAAKAEKIGTGGISSDDPEATTKLREQLAQAEKNQANMKAANVLVKKGDVPGLMALGFTELSANELMKKDFGGRVGFPSYMLTNNNANIRRIRGRIEVLEAAAKREAVEVKKETYSYAEDTDENRVMFKFDGKPSEEIRNKLKSNGFKWSPSRDAWVRQLNANGICAGVFVRKFLDSQTA